jgi:hypothetical protein
MVKVVVLGLGLFAPALALACGGDKECGSCSHHEKTAAAVSDPASCAKKAELVGGACSYTTGMMAQRVLSEGKPWSFTGTLARTAGDLESHVAAPYTVGPDKVHVVANEVLEALTAANAHAGRVGLEGKLLDVDGVKYFVLTSYAVPTS